MADADVEYLPNGKRMTPENIERWFAADVVPKMKKRASRELSVFLTKEGKGEEDGGYEGGYSFAMADSTGKRFVVYAQFIRGVCVQAVNIPLEEMEHMAMEYVVAPAQTKAALESIVDMKETVTRLWMPGEE